MVVEDVSYTSILRISLPALLLNGDPRLTACCLLSVWTLCCSDVSLSHAVAAPLVVTVQTALLVRFGGSAAQAAFAAVGTTANATCLLFNFLVDGISAKACFQGWAFSMRCIIYQDNLHYIKSRCGKAC